MSDILVTESPQVSGFVVHKLDPSLHLQEAVRLGRAYHWVMTKKPAVQLLNAAEKLEFERRWVIAEALKTEMRKQWADFNGRLKAPEFDDGQWREGWLALSNAFWMEYEQVNRDYIPDDPVYSITLMGVTASTAAIWAEYKPSATGQARVLESYFGGEATSSTVERIGFFVATTAGVTPTAYTPNKMNQMSAAAAGTAATAYTTQPVFPTNPSFVHAFNAFGGTDRWVPQPGEELYVHGQGTVGEPGDWQPKAGTAVMSSHGMVEEM